MFIIHQKFNEISITKSTGFIPDSFLILAYPVYTFVYLIITLIFYYKKDDNTWPTILEQYLLYGLIILSPIVWDMVYHFLFSRGSIISSINVVVFLFLGILPLIGLDAADRFKNLIAISSLTEALKKKRKHLDPVSKFIHDEINKKRSSKFTSYRFTKALMYDESKLPISEWEKYFYRYRTNFSNIKKLVRIKIAIRLIMQGYLDRYSIEALSNDIGYRSRTSFYSAFEQIQNQTFPDFYNSFKSSD